MNQGGRTPKSPPRPTPDLAPPSPHVRVQLAALGEEQGSCYLFSPTPPIPPTHPTHCSRSPSKALPEVFLWQACSFPPGAWRLQAWGHGCQVPKRPTWPCQEPGAPSSAQPAPHPPTPQHQSPRGSQPAAGLGSGTPKRMQAPHAAPPFTRRTHPSPLLSRVHTHGACGAFFPEDPEDTDGGKPASRPLTSTETPKDLGVGSRR